MLHKKVIICYNNCDLNFEGDFFMHNEKGFVRRVDELGRVVIPKELRFALKIETGTMLEFFCENNKELHLCKYEPLRQISDLGENCLHALKGHDCGILLCDSASVIAVQNLPKKDFFFSEK